MWFESSFTTFYKIIWKHFSVSFFWGGGVIWAFFNSYDPCGVACWSLSQLHIGEGREHPWGDPFVALVPRQIHNVALVRPNDTSTPPKCLPYHWGSSQEPPASLSSPLLMELLLSFSKITQNLLTGFEWNAKKWASKELIKVWWYSGFWVEFYLWLAKD